MNAHTRTYTNTWKVRKKLILGNISDLQHFHCVDCNPQAWGESYGPCTGYRPLGQWRHEGSDRGRGCTDEEERELDHTAISEKTMELIVSPYAQPLQTPKQLDNKQTKTNKKEEEERNKRGLL